MTPTELQALMDREGVPMEARAPIINLDDIWFNNGHADYVEDMVEGAVAELAHVGAMVKYLFDLHGTFDPKAWLPQHSSMSFPTLVEALAHACGQVAKEKAATNPTYEPPSMDAENPQ